MKTIEEQIGELIENVGKEHSVLRYVYNNGSKFVPGVSPVYYSGPYFQNDNEEIIQGIKTLLTGAWIASGEEVRKFEIEFARKINMKHALMLNSGSSANLVMIAATKKHLSWNDGDEIITSVVGFPTTVAPIAQNNLVPVFIDIEMDSLNFNLDLIEEKITEKTKAIFLSPVLGNPPNMERIVDICSRHNLILLLDDCDSLGSKWNGMYLNEYAYASSNSFFVSHHLTSLEGGMVVSNDKELIRIARSFAWWGRSCLENNAPIFTKNGVVEIKDVSVGDEVLTHTGQYKKVTELIRNRYVGKMVNIKTNETFRLKSTANHPFLVLRDGNEQWISADQIMLTDKLLRPIIKENTHNSNFKLEYDTFAGQHRSEEYIFDEDLMRLLGYYAAEGSLVSSWTSKGKFKKGYRYPRMRVDFAFNKNEIEYIKDVEYLMKKYFNVSMQSRILKNQNGISLSFNTLRGYEFFKQIIPGKSYEKKLPGYFLEMDKKLLIEFVKGFWRGDGSDNGCNYSISTTSPSLYEQIVLILNKNNINTSVIVRTPEQHTQAIVNGRIIISRRNTYTITINKFNSVIFENLTGEQNLTNHKTIHVHKVNKISKFTNNHAWIDISDITYEEVDDIDVYNFEVEDDHSYVAFGVAVHNCHCVGAANLLPNGACGNRFDKHLENYDGIIDHKYVFETMGYNLKPLDFQGSIGLVQLKKFDEIHEKRISNKERIEKCILENLDVHVPTNLPEAETSWFGVPFVCKSREQKESLVAYFEEKKIQTRHYFAGNLLLHPGYKHLGNWQDYPEANKVLSHVFFIGCTPQYTEEILQYIEKVIREYK